MSGIIESIGNGADNVINDITSIIHKVEITVKTILCFIIIILIIQILQFIFTTYDTIKRVLSCCKNKNKIQNNQYNLS